MKNMYVMYLLGLHMRLYRVRKMALINILYGTSCRLLLPEYPEFQTLMQNGRLFHHPLQTNGPNLY